MSQTRQTSRFGIGTLFRYSMRAMFVLLAMFVLFFVSAISMPATGYLSVLAILGLGLAALIQWPEIKVGWIVGATFLLAVACAASAPTISDGRLRAFWQTQSAFVGAILGILVAACGVLSVTRGRFRIRHLLELAVALSLVMALYHAYSAASVPVQRCEPPPINRVTAADLAAQLETAFQASSEAQLDQFFDDWHASLRAKPLDEITDPVERDLYSLYKAFFNPYELDRLTGYESGHEPEKEWDILVLQDSIRYCIGEDLPEQFWTLTEFRPQVRFPNTKSVFLTPVYRDAIEMFLDRDMEGDDIQRYRFLKTKISIFPGHWWCWELLTAPSVLSVEFNEERTQAEVFFCLISEGGAAKFKRQGDEWILVDSGLGWMQ